MRFEELERVRRARTLADERRGWEGVNAPPGSLQPMRLLQPPVHRLYPRNFSGAGHHVPTIHLA
jgi:hypothetical protein